MKKYKRYFKYIIILLSIVTFFVTICFIPFNATSLIPVIEKQVENDLGAKIHIEKLVLRFGPLVKVKAPIVHVMYSDGQKFGQLEAVKFYVSWSALLKKSTSIDSINAKKMIIRISSDNKYLQDLINKTNEIEFSARPNLRIKDYSISYNDLEKNNKYVFSGKDLKLDKIISAKTYKVSTIGDFSINGNKHISIDLSLTPLFEFNQTYSLEDTIKYFEKIKDLDFYANIIAALKLYKNNDEQIMSSGFVNVDNISVLDKDKKVQKSYIYLTLLGDKASILSNIYTSYNKNVYIEGKITNSKKANIDLKVKAEEIALEDLYPKLRFFMDMSKLKNIESLKGKLNANFVLKGDINKIKSSGYLKLKDASIKADNLLVENINSNIDFQNNNINITNAIGYVNSAPIMVKGNINKNLDLEILMSKVELNKLLPKAYGIKKGVLSLVVNLSGTLDKINHKENIQIDNFLMALKNDKISLESLKFDTNKDNTAIIKNILYNNSNISQVKIPTLKLDIEKDYIHVPTAQIYMPNSVLKFNADISNYNDTNNLGFSSNIVGNISSRDIKILNKSINKYPLKISVNGNKNIINLFGQTVLEKPEVFDEPSIANLSVKLENNNLKIEDFSILNFNGKFSDELKNNLKGNKKITLTGTVEDINKPKLKNIRLNIPQFININAFDTIIQSKGDLFINGNPMKPEIMGQLNIKNIVSPQLQLVVSNSIVDFNNNTININTPNLKIADTALGFNASISNDFSKAINIKNINIKSKYLNSDTLLMYKDFPAKNNYPIVINEGKLYSERVASNVYGAPLYITSLTTDFDMHNNIVNLKNISGEMFNGKITGTINYNLFDENFDSKIMARGVSALPIFNIISNKKDNISGVLDFDTKIKGNLSSKQSLNGDIKFIVHNGRMSSLGKLEHLLYAQNVVADNMLRTSLSVITKAITLKDTGLFKYLRGDVSLKDGIANIKMLQSQGPLMSMFIKGYYNPMDDYARLTVLGRLSDEIVSGLGAFGEFSFQKLMIMLTGDENKYNIHVEDFEKIPQLNCRNTKEFRAIINGNIEKPSSVLEFNWISYTQKALKQISVPNSSTKVPSFVDNMQY